MVVCCWLVGWCVQLCSFANRVWVVVVLWLFFAVVVAVVVVVVAWLWQVLVGAARGVG